MSDAHAPASHRRDSHESLARAIAREVQTRLPQEESGSALRIVVEQALHAEARGIELTLAYFRVAALGIVGLVSLAAVVVPSHVGTPVPPSVTVSVVIAFALAAVFAVALHRGWYHHRLRRFVPAADAALIVLLVLLFVTGTEPDETIGIGVAATAAAACVFLVLTGPARLSAVAQRITATVGVGAWLCAALLLSTPAVLLAAVTIFLLTLASLGTRFATIVRGLVATEAHGQRLGGLYEDARAAIDAREEVLRMVAHDLRNPLSTISMTTQMLDAGTPDDAARERYVGIIGRATSSMNRLIHDLLDVARFEAGSVRIEPARASVQRLLERAHEQMAPIAEAAQLQLTLFAEPDLPDVLIDEERVLQVLSNLIGNAVKFTPPGGTITLRARREADVVRFGVLDTGPGIAPERAERIFDRFWQADPNDRRGIGLGLAIARSIVEAHDQRIGVDCPPGGGSEFWFTAAIPS